MVDDSRAALRRMGQEQNTQYKRTLAFIIFILVTLTMITVTFLNPLFMRSQIKTSYNRAVIVRQVNGHFDDLADLIGANRQEDSNLLTVQQTQPIAEHVIDYSLGFHWVKFNNLALAKQILSDIHTNIDRGASSDAQRVNQRLKKVKGNAPYLVAQAFDLNVVTLGANIALLLLVVNIIVILVTIVTLFSLLSDLRARSSAKSFIHDVTAAGMWAGFWLILGCGLLALIPIIFNVEALPLADLDYLLEISSSIFLEFVIAGVVIFVLCAIPWQASAAN